MKSQDKMPCHDWRGCGSHGSDAVYGLGLLGALVYFWQNSPAMASDKLVAIFKALTWPGWVVYQLLGFLHL